MILAITNHAAEPHCGGLQWTVSDLDGLANLIAAVLQGRAADAAGVIAGATLLALPTAAQMKAQIRAELFPGPGPKIYHRDGLLFEIICWIVALDRAEAGEIISQPHTKATQQGMDTFKVAWNDVTRSLTAATVYEYKCTTGGRAIFRSQVMKAFKAYYEGKRDSQLVQEAIALLAGFNLNDLERAAAYKAIIYDRPLKFDAALTVQPPPFDGVACVDLFDHFSNLGERGQRQGSTMPLDDVRQWFEDLAALVWIKIDV